MVFFSIYPIVGLMLGFQYTDHSGEEVLIEDHTCYNMKAIHFSIFAFGISIMYEPLRDAK
jgi:hypothetical protein